MLVDDVKQHREVVVQVVADLLKSEECEMAALAGREPNLLRTPAPHVAHKFVKPGEA
jgi:hypothetical protein